MIVTRQKVLIYNYQNSIENNNWFNKNKSITFKIQ